VQKLIYGIGVFLVLLIVIGFFLPRTNRIEVSVEIDAHPATVFALINDFRRFSHWSPWSSTDPDASILYSGARRGEGAIMSWNGAVIGSGRQVITESRPYERVAITMNSGETGEAMSWFDLTPGIGTTIVARNFEIDSGMNIVGRYFAPLMGGVVAREYHDGLVRLKEFAEGLPAADFGDLEIEHLVVEATDIAYLPSSSRPEPAAISEALGKAYFQILTFIADNGLSSAGAPRSILRPYRGSELGFDAAIPLHRVNANTPRETVGVRIGQSYAGLVVRVRHIGSYAGLTGTHRKISAYLAASGIERDGAAWESYVSDPGKVPERELQTDIFYPIKAD